MTSRPTGQAGIDTDPIAWWSVAAAISAALVFPLFMTPLPPLLDYPNHLARMLVILRRDDPVIARMYSVDPAIVPNVAMDVLVPPLAAIMPLDIAGRMFIAICLLLPVAGAAVLHRALFDRRSYWPLGIALASYNGLLFLGFLNFLAGLGLALLAGGVWVRQSRGPTARRVVVASVFALALFMCHLMAVACFGAIIAAREIDRIVRETDKPSGGEMTRRFLMLAIPFVFPFALFVFAAPLAPKLAPPSGAAFFADWWAALIREGVAQKLLGATLPFRTYAVKFGPYQQNLDFFAFAMPAILLLRAIGRRLAGVAWGVLALVAAACLAYPVVPSMFGTAALIDWRLPLFSAFLCFSALDPAPPRDGLTRALVLAAAILFVARIANIAVIWRGHDRDLADLARVIAPVAPGARVLAVTTAPRPNPGGDPQSRGVVDEIDATMHLPALVLLDRHAFWPDLFTSRTLQPVHVRPPYLALSMEQGELPDSDALERPTEADLRANPFLLNWKNDFDYVLVMRPNALTAPLDPADLDPIARADIAALYRIRR